MGIYEYNEEEHIHMEREDAMDQGISQGISQGIIQGETLTLIKMVKKKIAKEKSLEKIAAELEAKEEDIEYIYDLIMKNPQKTEHELLHIIEG